jgi:hypothetical protein
MTPEERIAALEAQVVYLLDVYAELRASCLRLNTLVDRALALVEAQLTAKAEP